MTALLSTENLLVRVDLKVEKNLSSLTTKSP